MGRHTVRHPLITRPSRHSQQRTCSYSLSCTTGPDGSYTSTSPNIRLHRGPFSSSAKHSLTSTPQDFSNRVAQAINSVGIQSTRTAYRSPWQNGIAERWVGTVRRELLDHVIVIDEKHLRRLLREYVDYYNQDRVHTQLRDSPAGRPTEDRPSRNAQIVGLPRVGGLHHRYVWRDAA